MKSYILIFLLFFSISTLSAQTEDAWVYFKNKPSAATYLAAPLTMLSQRSLDRRTRYNIPLDSKDVPVETTYITQIESAIGITVLAKSKWLNAVHVKGTQINVNSLLTLNFVESVEYANKLLNTGSKPSKVKTVKKSKKLSNTTTNFDYGQASNQITMLNVETLHSNNFTGEGIQIAVIDAGFPNVKSLIAFKELIDNSQLLGGYNFVDRNIDYDTRSSHGTHVLSSIAGYKKTGVNGATEDYVGTAPGASFYLFVTEDDTKEVPLEESLWVEAAEEADRLGVDIINSSLGYSVFFDNTNHNYSYSAMDGKTAFTSRAAEIAFSRGMIIVNSMGNEGNDSAWPYTNSPADASSVLSIGAVNSTGVIASFSSFGPTFDGRLKPDVCAQGASAYLVDYLTGNVVTGSGTSFSSPIMAGAVACLWQAFPDKSNIEITQLIKESGDLYLTPNAQEGYGIPNFGAIYTALSMDYFENRNEQIELYPNPVSNKLTIKLPFEVENTEAKFYNLLGQLILTETITSKSEVLDVSLLEQNIYIVEILFNNKIQHFKIIKN